MILIGYEGEKLDLFVNFFQKKGDDAQDKMHADHPYHDGSRDYRDGAERYVFLRRDMWEGCLKNENADGTDGGTGG